MSRPPTWWSSPAASVPANRTLPWSSGSGPCTRTTMWTLSVGTGSSYLAAAGALDGATAATHWASAQRLTDAGVTYSDRSGSCEPGRC